MSVDGGAASALRGSGLLPGALFLQGVVTLSPLVPAAGIPGSALYVVAGLVTALELVCNRRTLPLRGLLLCAAAFLGHCIDGVYWGDPKLTSVSLLFIGSVLLTGVAERRDVERFMTALTWFLFAVLVLSWVGLAFVRCGGSPIWSLRNVDGRQNFLYATTLSNYRVGDSIRPAGPFDEPGTLSFLVCALAALRSLYGRRAWVSLGLLGLGAVTFTMTHAVFTLLFLLLGVPARGRVRLALLLCAAIAAATAYALFLQGPFDDLVAWRLRPDPATGSLAGDNRIAAVRLAWSHLSPGTAIWGLDAAGVTRVHALTNRFGAMTATPLGPLVTAGLLVSFPYYLFLALLLVRGLSDPDGRVYLAVVVLFLPRPYVTSFGYSVLAMLFLYSLDRTWLHRGAAGRGAC